MLGAAYGQCCMGKRKANVQKQNNKNSLNLHTCVLATQAAWCKLGGQFLPVQKVWLLLELRHPMLQSCGDCATDSSPDLHK
jgi:hypothetical protein